MSKRALSVDSYTGITETFAKDGDKIHIKKTADVSLELAQNKRDLMSSGSGWKDSFHRVASVPCIVIEMWTDELRRKGAPDTNPLSRANIKFLKQKLNSRDWYALRTKDGVI